VLRDGEVKEFDIMLQPVESLVPVHQYDKLPCYYIYAGGPPPGARQASTQPTAASCALCVEASQTHRWQGLLCARR
jgi:hypothetical protein